MRWALAIGVMAAVVLAGFSLRGGEDPYTVQMRLANAGGLSDGAAVVVGGVSVGTVRLEPTQDDVAVKVDIEPGYAPIGKDASATIIARNAIGQKQLLLTPGDSKENAAPEGYTLPRTQITTATDLDQLLSTLGAETRTRLAVLLNEAGMTFAGRRLDFKAMLRELAPSLSSGSDLLGQLTRNNRALSNVLASSDRFVGTLAVERRKLSRMLDLVGRTTETVATRRGALRATLRRAPTALVSARSFLADLRRTAGPLGSTARRLARTAPSLRTTLERVEPFRRAAAPTLASARAATPVLNRLIDSTTTSLRKARPALRSLQAVSQTELPPVGSTLDNSMDNLLGTIDTWSRAVQFGDGLSHVFRGEASFGPSSYERIITNLTGGPPATRRSRRRNRDRRAERPQRQASPAPAPADGKPQHDRRPLDEMPVPRLPELPGLPQLPDLPNLPGQASPRNDWQGATSLLDYLLSP